MLSDKQAHITINGGQNIPFYVKGQTSDDEIHEQIKAMSGAPFIQLLGSHTIVNFQYKEVVDILAKRSIEELVDYLDEVVEKTNEVYGLQFGVSVNSNKNVNNRVMFETPDTGIGYASATYGYVRFQKDSGATRDLAA